MILNKQYTETPCDISLGLTGCTTNLQIFPQGSSGARVVMQGGHYVQTPGITKPELRFIFAGPEKDYANYMFNVTVEKACTVIRVVDRHAKPGASATGPLHTLVFVEQVPEEGGGNVPIIDVIEIPLTIQNHPTFPVILEKTKLGKSLGAGTFLRKGDILAQTRSVIDDEYCVGVNANVLLVSHPMVIEDAVIVSQKLADSMMSYGQKTYRYTIGHKDYPLFLYEDKSGRPTMFPDIGEKVRDDGILFAKREHDTILAAVEMSETALKEPCGHFDECTFTSPEAVVTDIKVHRDDLRPRRYDPDTGESMPSDKMSTPVGMQEVCDMYADGYSGYQSRIRDLYRHVEQDHRRRGHASVSYTPGAKQAIMYAIADDPHDIDRSLSRYKKQFGSVKCDDYVIEITVRYPIHVSIASKLTDTMGGKGIIARVAPNDEMPMDKNGNRVDIMMSENAMLRRTNFNRGFESFVNASRRDAAVEVNKLFESEGFEVAFTYLVNYVNAVNPEWCQAILDEHQTDAERHDLILGLYEGREDLRLWIPSDNRYTMDDIERNIRNDYPPMKDTLSLTEPDGTVVESKEKFSIGQLYMILLDKHGGEFSAVSAGRFQAFGTIAKQNSADKHRRPIRENPITHMGGAEARHQAAYRDVNIPGIAEAHDRSNNPAVADEIVMNILSAEVPSNIEHAVDRKKHPLGHNRVMEIGRHIMRCDGIGFTTRRN